MLPERPAAEVKAPMPFGDLEPFGRQNAGQDRGIQGAQFRGSEHVHSG